MVYTLNDAQTALRFAAVPVAGALGVPRLPEHAPTLALSFGACIAVQVLVAPPLLKRIGGERYTQAKAAARNQWNVRVVAFIHALVIVPLAFRLLDSKELDADRVYGWQPSSGTMSAVACGYFLWDSLESFIHFVDPGFVVHGLACLAIYLLSFKPFLAFYGARFLLWELSTPFLNIHWFLDKMGKTGTPLQFVNGVLLLSTFAITRLYYGTRISIEFYNTLYQNYERIPDSLILIYGIGNILLNGLNWYWFFKMTVALRKRFQPGGAVGNGKIANGKVE